MNYFAVLTALGTDRVGIVNELSREINEKGCNIEESRMSVLGGEFAVILLLAGAEEAINNLSRDLTDFGEEKNLTIKVKTTGPYRKAEDRIPYIIESVSIDHPGIVRSVTDLLRELNINIEDLETKTSPAPWTGAPLFHLKMVISVPSALPAHTLKQEILEIGEKKDLDISIFHVHEGER